MSRGNKSPDITPHKYLKGEARGSTKPQEGTSGNTEHQVHHTSHHGQNVGRDSNSKNERALCTKHRAQPPRDRPLLRATIGSDSHLVMHSGRVTKPRPNQERSTIEPLFKRGGGVRNQNW